MVRKVFLILVLLIAFAGPQPGRALTPAASITVTTTEDTLAPGACSLRQALLAANSDAPVGACPAGSGADLVLLPVGVYTLSLMGMEEDAGLTGDLDITSSLTLRGAGQEQTIIDADMIDRVLDIHPGVHIVKLEDLTVRNGGLADYDYDMGHDFHTYGEGIRNRAELELLRVLVLSSGVDYVGPYLLGQGIYNSGKLSLESSTVRGAWAGSFTGAVYNAGEMIILNSAINHNFAEYGSGPGIYNAGTAYVKNTNLDNNRQDITWHAAGGNIYNSGVFICEQCSIVGGVGEPGSVIYNNGAMSLIDSKVGQGSTRYGSGSVIATFSTLSLLRTQVSDSSMRGIQGSGTLSITNSKIANHDATTWANREDTGGGGLYFDGTVTIIGTLFENNDAGLRGGGAYGRGQWTIRDSAFISNETPYYSPYWDTYWRNNHGGAIYWDGGVLTVTNTTFSANRSTDTGGAIYIKSGEVRLDSVTITENRSADYGGAGGLAVYDGTATLFNSIIAWNASYKNPDCDQVSYDPPLDYIPVNEVISLGYNLLGTPVGCNITPAVGDIFGDSPGWISPELAPLADNGGQTPTHALLPNSPALDQGSPTACPATDQRGVPRPQGSRCDIGAFELEQEPAWLPVEIDIRPGNDHNPINPNSRASVPVAILSGPGFYAPTQVDPASLTFGRTGLEDTLIWLQPDRTDCHLRDANKDRQLDLVCRFRVSGMGFLPGDTMGYLRGTTLVGQPILGEAPVTILFPTNRVQDEADTLLDLNAYLGDALLWLPSIQR
jgi:predicted outer membrane repeat protein